VCKCRAFFLNFDNGDWKKVQRWPQSPKHKRMLVVLVVLEALICCFSAKLLTECEKVEFQIMLFMSGLYVWMFLCRFLSREGLRASNLAYQQGNAPQELDEFSSHTPRSYSSIQSPQC